MANAKRRRSFSASSYTAFEIGERHEALTFGLFLMVMKTAGGLSAGAAGAVLAASGYGGASERNRLPGLITAMAAFPLIGAMISVSLLRRHDRSHAAHRRLQMRDR